MQKDVTVKKPAVKKQKPNKDDDLIIYSLNTKSENQQTATMSRKTKSIPRKQLKKGGAKLRKSVPKTTTGHKIVNIASGNQSEQVETQSAAVDQVILENDPSELFKEMKTP